MEGTLRHRRACRRLSFSGDLFRTELRIGGGGGGGGVLSSDVDEVEKYTIIRRRIVYFIYASVAPSGIKAPEGAGSGSNK